MKMWMIVTVETELEWPAEETSVSFMGHKLILRPPDGNAVADVRLQYEHPQSERQAFETICRFLTTLSWWYHRPARARLRIARTAPTRGGKGGYGPPVRKDYKLPTAIQSPNDPKARIALALYREAMSVQNTSYEFLAYFKIINVCYSKGKDQIAWINSTLPLLTDTRARKRVSELASPPKDIGNYLYDWGRCAVAHAFSDPVVDPDNPDDVFRLSADVPVVRALAEYLIENELGVKWELSRCLAPPNCYPTERPSRQKHAATRSLPETAPDPPHLPDG